MNTMDLKTLVKSEATLECVKSGGIAVYIINTENDGKYQFEIDLSDKHDVGETATFMAHYNKSLTLMRWIRRALENNTLIKIG